MASLGAMLVAYESSEDDVGSAAHAAPAFISTMTLALVNTAPSVEPRVSLPFLSLEQSMAFVLNLNFVITYTHAMRIVTHSRYR